MITPTRDLGMAMVAFAGALLMAVLGAWVFNIGGWWRLALIPIAILWMAMVYGAGDSIQLKDRSKDRAERPGRSSHN